MSRISVQEAYRDRFNPEFLDITQQFQKKKKQWKDLHEKEVSAKHNMQYLQRVKESLNQSLHQKNHELKYLKKVRKRHYNDIQKKQQYHEKLQLELQNLRERSQEIRQNSKNAIATALYQSRRSKQKMTKEVKTQLSAIKHLKSIEREQQNKRYSQINDQRDDNKKKRTNKINHFFRKKNKMLMNSYRGMIASKEQETIKSKCEIQNIERSVKKYENSINKKKKKLNEMESEISTIKTNQINFETARHASQLSQSRNLFCLSDVFKRKDEQTKDDNF